MLIALIKDIKAHLAYRLICLIICLSFVFTTMPVSAQILPYMPPVGTLLTQSEKPYDLPYIVGMQFSSDNIFDFTFFLNRGDAPKEEKVLRSQVEQANKYFLAALTIPEKDLWVNLSPYEQNRIITPDLSRTDLGKDLLGEDYVLKQLASSLTHPDSTSGKEYWKTLKNKNNNFCKVWIVPGVIRMREASDRVVITEAKLKVLTDEDYFAAQKNGSNSYKPVQNNGQAVNPLQQGSNAQAMRDAIVPLIEKEVNTGKHFSQLRQAYYSIIMAGWFKKKLKDTILNQIYFNQKKTDGAENNDPAVKDKIYREYVSAFNQGVYKVIKQERSFNKITQRQYFSGGALMTDAVSAASRAVGDTPANVTATIGTVSANKATGEPGVRAQVNMGALGTGQSEQTQQRVETDMAVEKLLPGNNLTQAQKDAILEAHLTGDGNIGQPGADGKYRDGTYAEKDIQAKLALLQAAGIEGVSVDEQGKLRIVTGSMVDKLMRGDGVNPPATGNKPPASSPEATASEKELNDAQKRAASRARLLENFRRPRSIDEMKQAISPEIGMVLGQVTAASGMTKNMIIEALENSGVSLSDIGLLDGDINIAANKIATQQVIAANDVPVALVSMEQLPESLRGVLNPAAQGKMGREYQSMLLISAAQRDVDNAKVQLAITQDELKNAQTRTANAAQALRQAAYNNEHNIVPVSGSSETGDMRRRRAVIARGAEVDVKMTVIGGVDNLSGLSLRLGSTMGKVAEQIRKMLPAQALTKKGMEQQIEDAARLIAVEQIVAGSDALAKIVDKEQLPKGLRDVLTPQVQAQMAQAAYSEASLGKAQGEMNVAQFAVDNAFEKVNAAERSVDEAQKRVDAVKAREKMDPEVRARAQRERNANMRRAGLDNRLLNAATIGFHQAIDRKVNDGAQLVAVGIRGIVKEALGLGYVPASMEQDIVNAAKEIAKEQYIAGIDVPVQPVESAKLPASLQGILTDSVQRQMGRGAQEAVMLANERVATQAATDKLLPGKNLTAAQREAIFIAHMTGEGNIGLPSEDGKYRNGTYDEKAIDAKKRILMNAGLTGVRENADGTLSPIERGSEIDILMRGDGVNPPATGKKPDSNVDGQGISDSGSTISDAISGVNGSANAEANGGFDFAATSANTKIDLSSDGGFKASAQKATAYLANGKVTGFKLAIVALNY